MEIITLSRIQDDLREAITIGNRISLNTDVANIVTSEILNNVESASQKITPALSHGPSHVDDALTNLVNQTNPIFSLIDIITISNSARQRAQQLAGSTAHALEELDKLAATGFAADFPFEMNEGEGGNSATASEPLDPDRATSGLLRLGQHAPTLDVVASMLANWVSQRLWALHARTLFAIATADTTNPTADQNSVSQLRSTLEAATRQTRDRLAEIALMIAKTQTVTPELTIRLRGAILDAEQAVIMSIPTLALAAATATDRAEKGPNNDPVVRDAGIAYDQVRLLLAYGAGAWAVFSGTATDPSVVAAFADAGSLPRSSATLDLPRSSIAQAKAAPTGTVVEIAGVVRQLTSRTGGPTSRSVLVVGAKQGAQIRVLVPFVAVDSFGVVPGVWAQIRGEIFAEGKDGLAGPVLQVRRIRRNEASRNSFADWMIWSGRRLFDLRPGGLDVVAGRAAASRTSLLELGFRMLEP